MCSSVSMSLHYVRPTLTSEDRLLNMVSPCLCALFFSHFFLFYWEDWRCLEAQIKSANPVSFLSLPLTTYCMPASFFMFSAPCGSSFFYFVLLSAALVMLSVQCTLILPSTASPCCKKKKVLMIRADAKNCYIKFSYSAKATGPLGNVSNAQSQSRGSVYERCCLLRFIAHGAASVVN